MSLMNQLALPKDKVQCIHAIKYPLDVEPFFYVERCPNAVAKGRHGYLCVEHRYQTDSQYKVPKVTYPLTQDQEQIIFLLGQEERAIGLRFVEVNYGLKSVVGVSMTADPEPYYQEAEYFLAKLREKDRLKKIARQESKEEDHE